MNKKLYQTINGGSAIMRTTRREWTQGVVGGLVAVLGVDLSTSAGEELPQKRLGFPRIRLYQKMGEEMIHVGSVELVRNDRRPALNKYYDKESECYIRHVNGYYTVGGKAYCSYNAPGLGTWQWSVEPDSDQYVRDPKGEITGTIYEDLELE